MIVIREANRNDAVAISRLITAVAKSYIAYEFTESGQEALLNGMTPEAVEQSLLEGYHYHLAHREGRICGVIGMRGYSHVYHLFVAADFQRQGIGRMLWDRARQASLAAIRLSEFTVYSSRLAEKFYCGLGFRRTGNEQTRQGVTAIPMRLAIDKLSGGLE